MNRHLPKGKVYVLQLLSLYNVVAQSVYLNNHLKLQGHKGKNVYVTSKQLPLLGI